MELTPEPPAENGDDAQPMGKEMLHWDPAGPEVNKRLEHNKSAVIDYVLHPPKGFLSPDDMLTSDTAQARKKALQNLIDMAFRS
jgi:hypothetical protein